jgi:hypothetical protein
VLDALGFPVTVAGDLELMDPRVFTDAPLGPRWRLEPVPATGPDTADPALAGDLAPAADTRH